MFGRSQFSAHFHHGNGMDQILSALKGWIEVPKPFKWKLWRLNIGIMMNPDFFFFSINFLAIWT
jgi:hypothetical protein